MQPGGAADRDRALATLTSRLGRLTGREPDGREESGGQPDLDAAHEELRVVEEEVAVQQAQIQELLGRYESERRWRSQLSALAPVGLCVTDGNGKLLDANPALAISLRVPLPRLRGKPLSVFFDPADVPRFRSALRALARGETAEEDTTVVLRGRRADGTRTEIVGFAERTARRATEARIQWVFAPEPGEGAGHPLAGATPYASGRSPADDALDERPTAESTTGLAAALAELSALPVAGIDRQHLVSRMAGLVQRAIPGASWASVTLGHPSRPMILGSDSTQAQEADGRQLQAAEGPCWEAYESASVVTTGDLGRDPRWPALARLSECGPVRSALAVPVPGVGGEAGVLNLYSPVPDAFGPRAVRIAGLVGAAVTAVLQSVAERESLQDLASNLERALASRAVIDQAKGVLMARMGVDAEGAFTHLVLVSNRLNVRLRELARLVVEGHADEVIAAGP